MKKVDGDSLRDICVFLKAKKVRLGFLNECVYLIKQVSEAPRSKPRSPPITITSHMPFAGLISPQ